jgi:hypothetical protein
MQVRFEEHLQSGRIRTDLRVVIFKIFVGSLTGPLTRRFLSFALLMRSVETAERVSAIILGRREPQETNTFQDS